MTDNPDASSQHASVTPNQRKRRRSWWLELLAVVAIIAVVVSLLLSATLRMLPDTRRMQCNGNLKQIALALHNGRIRVLSVYVVQKLM